MVAAATRRPCAIASTAASLADADAARDLEVLLAPYAGQFLMTPLAGVVFDAADTMRGMLLLLLGRVDEAVVCLESGDGAVRPAPRDVHTASAPVPALATALLARDDAR